MMKRLLVLACIGLSACAPTTIPWSNPGIPKDQWGRDYSACRRLADREVGWREDDNSGSALRDYDRQQAQKRFQSSLAGCMVDRGYVPASRNKE